MVSRNPSQHKVETKLQIPRAESFDAAPSVRQTKGSVPSRSHSASPHLPNTTGDEEPVLDRSQEVPRSVTQLTPRRLAQFFPRLTVDEIEEWLLKSSTPRDESYISEYAKVSMVMDYSDATQTGTTFDANNASGAWNQQPEFEDHE